MKIKDIFSPLLFIILGIAFLTVSLWVILSKNKNAKAIKCKYKLGGLLLSLSFFASGCDNQNLKMTCYDASVPDNTIYSELKKDNIVTEKDTIFFSILSPTYPYYSYRIADDVSDSTLKEGILSFSDTNKRYLLPFTTTALDQGDYTIKIYGEMKNEMKQSKLLYAEKIKFNAIQN